MLMGEQEATISRLRKKILSTMTLLLFLVVTSFGQATYNLDSAPCLTEQKVIGGAKKSTETALYKGIEYPVYIGLRGGKFIAYINTKGCWTKKYITKS